MDNIRLLDCTLREAPVDGFFIGSKIIKEFIYCCENIGIDIIECGFLKDVDYQEGSNCFRTVEQIREYIPDKKQNSMYVALMDYGRYSLDNLSEYDGTSIDGIRICFKHGEQKAAIETAARIKEKGYKVFVQHVDTLAYSDIEIIEFIKMVNDVHPYAYAIVDTFGSMYADELDRLAMLVDYHLDSKIVLGFHAHNNLMLANSNAQNFILKYAQKRNIIIDSSVLGCGRGAGNANTELLVEFLRKKYHRNYDLNAILDMIDSLMPKFQKWCTWGYSIPYFLAGVHSAHVYNTNYLLRRHNIQSRDLRAIIEKLDRTQKKAYDYTLLEKLYIDYFSHLIDDSKSKQRLKEGFGGRKLLLLAPGKTLETEADKIWKFIADENPVIIGVNDIIKQFAADYLFFSSGNRYKHYCYEGGGEDVELIITSNIVQNTEKDNEILIDYESLVKCGWINIDSSMILLLRLLASLDCLQIYIAGFDGFTQNNIENYYSMDLMTDMKPDDLLLLTEENKEMLIDLLDTNLNMELHFITTSQYEIVLEGTE